MSAAHGVRAVLFDLDGTIRINLPAAGEVFDAFVVNSGLSISSEDRLRAARWEHYYFADSPEIRADKAAFDGSDEAFWLNFGRRRLTTLGLPAASVDALAIGVAEHMRENYRPTSRVPDGVPALLHGLRSSGVTLGVVSNRTVPFGPELEDLGLAPLFDFCLAAGEVGFWKPQPEIFLEAARRAHVTPAEAVYVGDNYFADVIGARAAGIMPVLYDPMGVFDAADCKVIQGFDGLAEMLGLPRAP